MGNCYTITGGWPLKNDKWSNTVWNHSDACHVIEQLGQMKQRGTGSYFNDAACHYKGFDDGSMVPRSVCSLL